VLGIELIILLLEDSGVSTVPGAVMLEERMTCQRKRPLVSVLISTSSKYVLPVGPAQIIIR
jgi:hypothetical protein